MSELFRFSNAVERDPAPYHVAGVAENEAGGHAERHDAERKDEQHRHEHELRRDGDSRPGLELHPRDERVGDDERGDLERRGSSIGPEERGERERDDEECAADEDRSTEISIGESAEPSRARGLDQARVVGREDDLGGHGG